MEKIELHKTGLWYWKNLLKWWYSILYSRIWWTETVLSKNDITREQSKIIFENIYPSFVKDLYEWNRPELIVQDDSDEWEAVVYLTYYNHKTDWDSVWVEKRDYFKPDDAFYV
jgi:hypothetical protein